MSELREQMVRLVTLAERIDERTERIDVRTEVHSTHLNNMAGLKDETARIANALERLFERHANRMFSLAVFGLGLLTLIILLLIAAYTGVPLKFGDGSGVKVEIGK